jgi:hypothetical protein
MNKPVRSTVQRVLRSPGTSIDPATRAVFDSRFGFDFSRVKVHTDDRAIEAARLVNARAFTSGDNIAFSVGQYQPKTPSGMYLLSHELTHVVQQRQSSAPPLDQISTPSDVHENQAGAVAEAFMGGRGVASLLHSQMGRPCPWVQTAPAGGSSTAPPKYEFTGKPALPSPPRTLLTDIPDYVNRVVTPGPDFRVVSVAVILNGRRLPGTTLQGSAQDQVHQAFLLWALINWSDRTRWNSEFHALTAIDFPPPAGGAGPQGQVKLSIDDRGAASAELIDVGLIAIRQLRFADGKLWLKQFGFADVLGEGHRWQDSTAGNTSPADIRQAKKDDDEVSKVIAALNTAPTAKAALQGATIVRVATLPAAQQPGTPATQQPGTPRAQQSGAPRVQPASIEAGEWKLIYEPHKKAKPTLMLSDRAFSDDETQFVGSVRGATVPASFHTILHEIGHAVQHDDYRHAWDDQVDAQNAVDTAAAPSKAKANAIEAELDAINNELASMSPGKAKTSKTKEKKSKEDKYAKASIEQVTVFDRAADATGLNNKQATVAAMNRDTTPRLQAFLTAAGAGSARPTTYSTNNAMDFYAEAYSLWKTDPEFLRRNYRAIYDFLENTQGAQPSAGARP